MSAAGLRLDLIPRRADEGDIRWSWRLWSSSSIVSSSGSQRYSRRIDCARGAEVGAGCWGVEAALDDGGPAHRFGPAGTVEDVAVRVLDVQEAAA